MLKWTVNGTRNSNQNVEADENLYFKVSSKPKNSKMLEEHVMKNFNFGETESKSILSQFVPSNEDSVNVSAPPCEKKKQLENNYATTLPLFEVEYSPSGLIPGELLALRGMGIIDIYFEKPRYFSNKEDFDTTKSTFLSEELKADDILRKTSESHSRSNKIDESAIGDMITTLLERNEVNSEQFKNMSILKEANKGDLPKSWKVGTNSIESVVLKDINSTSDNFFTQRKGQRKINCKMPKTNLSSQYGVSFFTPKAKCFNQNTKLSLNDSNNDLNSNCTNNCFISKGLLCSPDFFKWHLKRRKKLTKRKLNFSN